ncbi:hypothetical protein GY45DRAFT_1047229 [Cubamyces sp. BRFM 1775]|nr:hypothetical protein GY45DRAFT_1047229 [Cubamyces sp. BRFM 1775]
MQDATCAQSPPSNPGPGMIPTMLLYVRLGQSHSLFVCYVLGITLPVSICAVRCAWSCMSLLMSGRCTRRPTPFCSSSSTSGFSQRSTSFALSIVLPGFLFTLSRIVCRTSVVHLRHGTYRSHWVAMITLGSPGTCLISYLR